MRIRAFAGLVPGEGKAAAVAAVPYDVVDRAEAAKLAEGNPDSLLHASRADISLPAGTDPYADEIYTTARANLDALQERGALVRESEPCLYLYRQTMGEHSQIGLVAVAHIDDYRDDIIRKHEKTRPAKEDDRTRLASTLEAHLGPVFLTYKERPEIDTLVSSIIDSRPADTDFVAADGIGHSVWRIPGGDELVALFDGVPLSYVADGHHRSASASRVGAERRAANPDHTGEEDYNWFLTVLFPGDQLKVLPYNRVVADLNGLEPEELFAEASKRFDVQIADNSVPTQAGEVRMYLAGTWYALKWEQEGDDPVDSLDVSVLQDRLLEPVLGIDDPRTNSRVDFVGGIRGTKELENRVDSGRDAVAFSLYPVTVDQLIAIADAGAIMPPKSTWFEPKLRSGLFIHTF
jgi:uncharacterized protein (DUF1015 family)